MGVARFTDEERLAAFLDKCQITETGCVEWTGARTFGYGRFGVGGRQTMLAHRWAYARWVGPLRPGMEIDHLCHNPACVRPAHLEQVTPKVNQERIRPQHGLRLTTHCAHGHKRTPETTRVDPGGHRHCRVCDQACSDRRGMRRAIVAGRLVVGGP